MFIQVSIRAKCFPPLSTYVVLSRAVFAQPSESHFQPSPHHNKFRELWCVGVDFKIKISATEDGPSGYLFRCPVKDLQVGSSSLKWRDFTRRRQHISDFLPFNWVWRSRCSTGTPTYTRDCVNSTAPKVSIEIVARQLGEPLFQMHNETDPPFAHGVSTIPHQSFLAV